MFQPVLGNDFDKAAKHRGLKVKTDVVYYEDQYNKLMVVGSPIIFGSSITDRTELQRRLHDVNLNSGSGSDLIVIKGVLFRIDSFLNPYIYDFNCTSMESSGTLTGRSQISFPRPGLTDYESGWLQKQKFFVKEYI